MIEEISILSLRPVVQPMDESMENIAQEIPDIRDEIDKKLNQEACEIICTLLTEQESLVICEYFFNNKTLKEIAKQLGNLSATRLGQIKTNALWKLQSPSIKELMAYFNIPIAEEWYDEKQLKELNSKEDYAPIKPKWVKVRFTDGIPHLTAHYHNIWQTRPVTRKIYDAWLAKALEEYETSYPRKATGQGASPFR